MEYKFTNIEQIEVIEDSIKTLNDIEELSVGMGNTVFHSDSSGIWLGSKKFSDAPFSVSMDGILRGRGAIIDGTININDGTIGGFTITATKMYATSDSGVIASDDAKYPFVKISHDGLFVKFDTSAQGMTMINKDGVSIGYTTYWGNFTTDNSWGFNSVSDFILNPGTSNCVRHSYGNINPDLGNDTYRWGGIWLKSSGSGTYTLNLSTGVTNGHSHTVAIPFYGRYFTINGETRLWLSF